ncbi:MAG: MFS transporter [Cyclobacteriaceae bacterium]|nr:MFS transporter [Cyclobacteriaceae bacterium HetDA_MAG_MS6]
MSAPALSKVKIFPILLVNFIGTLGYSIVLPFLVVLVLKFGGNELIYGVMGATYSFFQLIGAPILGNWSDRVGRRKVLLLSQGGTFLAWCVFLVALLVPDQTILEVNSKTLGAFVLTIPLVLLFVARALDGITGGNVSVANAYLADISTDKTRKKNFGQMSAAANLGFIIGPAFAGILGATILGDLLPVVLALAISLIAIFVIAIRLEEYEPCILTESVDPDKTRKVLGQEQKECHGMAGSENVKLSDVLKLKNVPFVLIQYFLIFLGFNFFYVAFPVHAVQTLEWDMFKIGLFFSVLSGTMVLVQGPILSKISDRFSEGALFVAGNFILAGGFYLFTFSSDPLLFLGAVLFAFGNGIMWPSFLSMLSKVAGQQYQGAVQGFASSAGSLASILGLILGGILYSLMGHWIFLLPSAVVFFICVSSLPFLKSVE